MRNAIDVSLSWMCTQYRRHQRQREPRLFTCFTIVMIGRGHPLPPSILFTFTVSFYMVTVCLCIYKLCCSSMFPTISSVPKGDCWTQHISGSRFQVCCLTRPKIMRNKRSCMLFLFLFLCRCIKLDEKGAVNEALASSCMWDECARGGIR